ncbi:unnamed protein product [Mesocestoides corti]|uniref:Uncharacterized protein n=1 Tax=Mesocestoides corti TaxID=53468 RepID=A0A158QUR6_MESCO|nr:unnamed protein product [Mesocestoides corti]
MPEIDFSKQQMLTQLERQALAHLGHVWRHAGLRRDEAGMHNQAGGIAALRVSRPWQPTVHKLTPVSSP